MRHFSDIEKQFINHILANPRDQRNLMAFLDPYLDKLKICVDLKAEYAWFLFDINIGNTDSENQWIMDRVEELQELIVIIVKLVEYLESEGFVVRYSVTPDVNKNEVCFGKGLGGKVSSPFSDKRVAQLLTYCIYKELVPLETLRDLVSNNYVTEEKRRFLWQQRMTWFSIVVSIVIGLSALITNILFQHNQLAASKTQYSTTTQALSSITELIKVLSDENKLLQTQVDNQRKEIETSQKSLRQGTVQ
jgi:hypothetical protein